MNFSQKNQKKNYQEDSDYSNSDYYKQPEALETQYENQQVPSLQNTLNEPISETIMRDLRQIGYKLKYVLNPRMRSERGKQLRNWDLWGPLLLCLLLAVTLTIIAPANAENIFGTIFVLIWAGAFVVTLNAQLLGGNISFFQSVCVLGYSVFPINIVGIIVAFMQSILPFFVRLIIVIIGFLWSTMSSTGFMAELISEEKKLLGVYPVCLFYLFLSWFVLII